MFERYARQESSVKGETVMPRRSYSRVAWVPGDGRSRGSPDGVRILLDNEMGGTYAAYAARIQDERRVRGTREDGPGTP